MPQTIEGNYRRLDGKRSKRKSRKPVAPGLASSGEFDAGWEYPGAETVSPDDVNAVQSFAQRFNAALSEFQQASNSLDAAESQAIAIQPDVVANGTAAEKAEFQTNYNRIIAVQATRDSAVTAIAQVNDWYNTVKNTLGLGLIWTPFSVIAVIATATAAIYTASRAWDNFFHPYQIRAWERENERRAAAGLPPLPPPAEPRGIFDNIEGIAMWIAVAVIGFALLKG